MIHSIAITYELTRDDVLAANRAYMKSGAAWREVEKRYKRSARRQMALMAPLIVAGAALLVGRRTSNTNDYLVGAGLGLAFAVFLLFAIPRLNTVQRTKADHLRSLERADLSAYFGVTSIVMDPGGVKITEPSRELVFSWAMVEVELVDDHVFMLHGGEATSIPPRAFATTDAQRGFIERATAWRRAAMLPHAERLVAYLRDHDVNCPGCRYSLRNLQKETCPECGAAIRLDDLVATPT